MSQRGGTSLQASPAAKVGYCWVHPSLSFFPPCGMYMLICVCVVHVCVCASSAGPASPRQSVVCHCQAAARPHQYSHQKLVEDGIAERRGKACREQPVSRATQQSHMWRPTHHQLATHCRLRLGSTAWVCVRTRHTLGLRNRLPAITPADCCYVSCCRAFVWAVFCG